MSVAGLTESAQFELADIALAANLAERLSKRWDIAVSAERSETVVVAAELRQEPHDVALLLREVEAFIAERSLCALRFELDERAYVLRAGEANWSIDVTAAAVTESSGRRARLLKALGSVDRALLRAPRGPASQIRGLEALRQDISLAIRLEEEESP